MATGHLNPGYFCPVSNLEKISKLSSKFENKTLVDINPEISNKKWLLTKPNLPNDILENIRRKARDSWTRVRFNEINTETTYIGDFQFKKLEDETKLRPSSPTRMNKPHPSAVFLTCHLHYLPGFHREETKSILNQAQKNDSEMISKMGIIRSQSVKNDTFLQTMDGASRTSSSDKESVDSLSLSHEPKQQLNEYNRSKSSTNMISNRSNFSTPLNQSRPTSSKFQRPYTSLPKYHTSSSRQCRTPSKTSLIYQGTEYPRGDYSIHYQWPVTIPHHRLY